MEEEVVSLSLSLSLQHRFPLLNNVDMVEKYTHTHVTRDAKQPGGAGTDFRLENKAKVKRKIEEVLRERYR